MPNTNPLRLTVPELRAATVAITERIRPLWEAGMPTLQIAAKLGMTKNQVIGKVHRSDMAPRGSPVGMAPWSEEEQAALRTMGYTHTARQIAAKLGRTVKAVEDKRKQMRRAGWKVKAPVAMPVAKVVIPEFRATVGGRIIPATAYGTSGRRMPLPVSVRPVVEVRLARWQEGEGCKYIAGEVVRRQAVPYCDAPRVAGTAYCPEHGRVCGVKGRPETQQGEAPCP